MAEITPEKLQSILNSKSFIDEISGLQVKVNEQISKVQTLAGSKLGAKAKEAINGVESIVSSVDYPVSGAQNVAATLAKINPADVPGLETDPALLASEIITFATPAAINKVLQNVTDAATTTILKNINKAIVADELQDVLDQVTGIDISDVLGDAGKGALQQIANSAQKADIDLGGLLTSIVESQSRDLRNAVESIGQFKLTAANITKIVQLTKDKDFLSAIEILKKEIPNLDENDVLAKLQALKVTVSEKIKTPVTPGVLTPPREMGTVPNYKPGQKPTSSNGWRDIFTYISTYEELEAEIKSIQRPITEVVFHWTETAYNKDIGSVEIEESTTTGIPFHYVIRRDGSIQRGRPREQVINHAGEGHSNYTLSVAFVGGISDSGQLSSTSFTDAQWDTFDLFCKSFYNAVPGGQVLGHNDIDESQVDPGFDVIGWVQDRWKKKSVFNDLPDQKAFSPSELKLALNGES